ncbi:uncharacterized protein LOC119856604 [Dermochelys coriacea]|uniref:uncharacterized protein LOC119856604 n=1 Tax=Dermochelys coriacea TaxID=27794 RepID=UPI0018E7920F|nr:uncharacterized protein LOC119856604 [Dermochelys coriacea]XP_038260204.1 uncharacterized protein LOC119856604 [Dermochelys coriacea]XP_043371699.1 uncharacterized protein LOC119856604 [Dermochelys coriacea]XP_043371701.1 uncharacterized protein LOC119856604 [Dermochelys coriacea]
MPTGKGVQRGYRNLRSLTWHFMHHIYKEVNTVDLSGSDMTLGASLPLCYCRLNGCAELESGHEKLKRTFCVKSQCTPWPKNQEFKEWQDSKKKDQKENVVCQNEATERLLNVMEHQADMLQAPLALQTPYPPSPAAAVTKLFPMHPPDTANALFNFLAPVCTHCIPLLPHHSPALQTLSTHCTQHLSLCSLVLLKYSTCCTVLKRRRLVMIPRHTQSLTVPDRTSSWDPPFPHHL